MAAAVAVARRRPFFRRRKTCPFSGANAPKIDYKDVQAAAALRLRARQDRAEPHHRGVGQEAARTRPGDQARALPRPAALRDPLRSDAVLRRWRDADMKSRPPGMIPGGRWLGRTVDPPLTAQRSGTARMMQIVLIGLGAGAAAALLFASVASGSPLSVLLFYLAPLPILIAALGWSHWAALIAAVVASAGARRRVRRLLLHRLPDRRRPAGLVARLSRAAGAPGDRTTPDGARMVSGRPSRVLGRGHRRRDRGRRHARASAPTSKPSARRCATASSACSSMQRARLGATARAQASSRTG